MTSADPFVFSALHLPRPLDAQTVTGFLARVASDRDAPRVVLETRADQEGTHHLLGCRSTDVHPLRQLLGDLIPGSLLTKAVRASGSPRPRLAQAGRLRIRPAALPLRNDAPEATARAVLSAFATRLGDGEAIALQLVLGPRHAPRVVPAKAPDPTLSLLQVLIRGPQPASTETRNRLRERQAHPGFAATIRLGAASNDVERRRRLVIRLMSALATAQAAGVHIDLVSEDPQRLNDAHVPRRWPLHLGVPELAGLLGWPIGDADLPGLPSNHPKPLRASSDVHTGSRVFASSAAPGDARRIGISPGDQTYHAVAFGPSGSGKSTALLHFILADIDAGRSIAVLDPKRQLIDDILARIPSHRIDDVVELNASDAIPVGFNPLDVADRDPDVVVDGILAVFEAVFTDGWGPRTADIFSACLRTLARASTPNRPATLVDLSRLFTDAAFRRAQVGRVQGDMALAGFWAWFDGQSPAAQAAAIAAPLNKLRQFLLRPALIKMLDQRTGKFRLRDTFRENKVLLAPLNEGLIGPGTASLLGSLIIADLWQATQERASEPGASKRPGVVYVDEAPRFLNLPVSLADALAVSRSLSVGWFLAAQFRSQFPTPLLKAVDMNARSKIVFATEFEDARDTARLSRDLTAEDFIALPRFHAYANLVAGGHPSGWALVKTLPPPARLTDPDLVRATARANYAPEPEDTEAPHPAAPVVEATNPAPLPVELIGRKRRRS